MAATGFVLVAFVLVALIHQVPFGYCYYEFSSHKDKNNQPFNFLSQGYPLTGKSTGAKGRLPYALLKLFTKGPDGKPKEMNFAIDLPTTELRPQGNNVSLSILLKFAEDTGFASSEQELIFWKCVLMGAYNLAKTVLQVADYELIKKLNEHLGPPREGITISPTVLTTANGVEKDITIEGIHGTFVGDRWDASKTWIATCSAFRKFESIPNLKTNLINICSDPDKLPIRFLNGTEGTWGYANGEGKNLLGRIMEFVGEKLKKTETFKEEYYQEMVGLGFVEFRSK